MPRVSEVARLVERASPRIPDPSPRLEQYTTPGDIAARLANWIALHEDLEFNRIVDLGAGTCRLSIALALYGARYIIGVDADPRLAGYCRKAFSAIGSSSLQGYIVSVIKRGSSLLRQRAVDLVVTNPPFGVQRRGMDTVFLEYAMSLGVERVYAILKTGNEQYHSRLAARHGYSHRVLYRERFPIPATMEHHRSRMRRVMVNVAVFEKI
ncbi:MAG: METTL5 family protein [Desulfurococcales archaeon]|nr:METTL5 family protein [Desulfurococcales archaeon]